MTSRARERVDTSRIVISLEKLLQKADTPGFQQQKHALFA